MRVRAFPARRRALRALLPLALLALLGPGCASRSPVLERTTQGPSAEEFFVIRSFQITGREPGFDERRHWENEIEVRVSTYLRRHPELEQSPRYLEFRFSKHVTSGSSRGEVRTLLEEPEEETVDPARLAALAERYWPDIRGKAKEAWVYSLGWVFYFDDAGVVAMFRRTPPPSDRAR
jgi:hypothetical protein